MTIEGSLYRSFQPPKRPLKIDPQNGVFSDVYESKY